MMHKMVLRGIFAFVLFSSCSSNETDPAPTDPNEVLLKKEAITTYRSDGSIKAVATKEYTYNGVKLYKITTDGVYDDILTYTDNLITKVEMYDSDNTFWGKKLLIYDEKQQLIEIRNENTLSTQYYYYYNPETSNYICGSSTSNQGMSFLNGNLIQLTLNALCVGGMGSPDAYGNLDLRYTYDTKNNPYKNCPGLGKYLVISNYSYLSLNRSGVNNTLTESVYFGCDQVELYSEYSYNSLNFPIVKKTYQIGPLENFLVYKTEYYYQ